MSSELCSVTRYGDLKGSITCPAFRCANLRRTFRTTGFRILRSLRLLDECSDMPLRFRSSLKSHAARIAYPVSRRPNIRPLDAPSVQTEIRRVCGDLLKRSFFVLLWA